jgi:hypothetical protein
MNTFLLARLFLAPLHRPNGSTPGSFPPTSTSLSQTVSTVTSPPSFGVGYPQADTNGNLWYKASKFSHVAKDSGAYDHFNTFSGTCKEDSSNGISVDT